MVVTDEQFRLELEYNSNAWEARTSMMRARDWRDEGEMTATRDCIREARQHSRKAQKALRELRKLEDAHVNR